MAVKGQRARYFAWSVEKLGDPESRREDVLFVDAASCVFGVADGVTRDPLPDGTYPAPSPARLAADAFSRAVASQSGNGFDPARALKEANEGIGVLNDRLGLSSRSNYLDRDRAGAVAAVAWQRGETDLEWAYVGDCGLAVIGASGAVVRETQDDVAPARAAFPSAVEIADRQERLVAVRSTFRNNVELAAGAYGVLTGEQPALLFVRAGEWCVKQTDAIAIFSDGFRPYLRRTDVPRLLADAIHSRTARREFTRAVTLLRNSEPSVYGDEASVVVWRTRERLGIDD